MGEPPNVRDLPLERLRHLGELLLDVAELFEGEAQRLLPCSARLLRARRHRGDRLRVHRRLQGVFLSTAYEF